MYNYHEHFMPTEEMMRRLHGVNPDHQYPSDITEAADHAALDRIWNRIVEKIGLTNPEVRLGEFGHIALGDNEPGNGDTTIS